MARFRAEPTRGQMDSGACATAAAKGRETPIGIVPTVDAIDRAGLTISDEALQALVSSNRENGPRPQRIRRLSLSLLVLAYRAKCLTSRRDLPAPWGTRL